MSTVSGKKSVPSRTERAAVAVARRTVSPMRPTTAPSASLASFPVSKDRVRSVPEIGPETVMASAMVLLVFRGTTRPVPSGRPPHPRPGGRWPRPGKVTGDWQPTCRRARLNVQPPGRRAGRRCCGRALAADAEAPDDGPVPLDVVLADVVEEPAAVPDELHQTSPGVVVPLVHLEVLGQVRDAVGQQRDLHLRRPGVGVVETVLVDDGLLLGHVPDDLRDSGGAGGPVRGAARPGRVRGSGYAHHVVTKKTSLVRSHDSRIDRVGRRRGGPAGPTGPCPVRVRPNSGIRPIRNDPNGRPIWPRQPR